ncbi:MAG TPA: diguanylate cyclase [Acidimicrobiales bacterium]|nr:diguanylate cyclase [Acidimicrobiales bacterium]
MTKFESRSLPEFELFGPTATENDQPVHRARPPAAPVTRDSVSGGEREPRFHSLGEQQFDVVAVLDEGGRFIFVSQSAERLFGYDIANVVGQDAFGLFDRSSADHVRALFDDLVARRRLSVSLEMQTVSAEGRPVDLDVVAANHLHDPIGGVVVNLRDVSESKRLEQRLREMNHRQATIIESLTDGVMIVDAASTVVRVNEAFEVMFESPRVRLLGRRLEDLMLGSRSLGLELLDAEGEAIDFRDHPIAASLRGGRRSVGVVVGVGRRGRSPMWVRANAQAMVDRDGMITGAVASFSDMTAARQAAAELRREEQFLQVLLDTLDEGIVACDAEGRITVFNPSARRLHGLADGSDPIGQIPTDQGLRHADGSPIAARENPLIRAMSGDQVREVEIVLESATGERRKVSVNGQALVDDEGWMLGAVVAMHDVTEQKRNEERLAELALHDPLTGLANRTLLAERLQEAIDRMPGRAPQPADGTGEGTPPGAGDQPGVAVFLLDLDDFKEINDVLGHDVGDDMLIAVARRLTAIVRPSDTVARLGGDEFVLVCDIESGEDEMLRITDRISTALAEPYRVDGRTLGVPASVGGVFVDNPDTDPSKLLSRADDAMYGVKWTRRRQRRSAPD